MKFIKSNKPLFKSQFKYKVYVNWDLFWDETTKTETWNNQQHKRHAIELESSLKGFNYLRQGCVFYCNLDLAFKLRLFSHEIVYKIEASHAQ